MFFFFFLQVKRNEYELFSSMTCVHEINKTPHFFMLSILCYVPRWKNKGMRPSLQRMSTFTGRCELYKWQVTGVFIESNTGLSFDSFCIVYIIHLPKHRSEVGFCFPPLNLSKIQQKKTFPCKLLH